MVHTVVGDDASCNDSMACLMNRYMTHHHPLLRNSKALAAKEEQKKGQAESKAGRRKIYPIKNASEDKSRKICLSTSRNSWRRTKTSCRASCRTSVPQKSWVIIGRCLDSSGSVEEYHIWKAWWVEINQG
ncbi:hypothetical protein HAX54_048650 [Datura stramonium]|uniref:Uncharacterized protein n=1 Tax=Datura stramonium TaxID=4076 RepID=A0ABS8WJI5_DATST|nr:hypothetical protein [Datura stramonium]